MRHPPFRLEFGKAAAQLWRRLTAQVHGHVGAPWHGGDVTPVELTE